MNKLQLLYLEHNLRGKFSITKTQNGLSLILKTDPDIKIFVDNFGQPHTSFEFTFDFFNEYKTQTTISRINELLDTYKIYIALVNALLDVTQDEIKQYLASNASSLNWDVVL